MKQLVVVFLSAGFAGFFVLTCKHSMLIQPTFETVGWCNWSTLFGKEVSALVGCHYIVVTEVTAWLMMMFPGHSPHLFTWKRLGKTETSGEKVSVACGSRDILPQLVLGKRK